MTDFGRDTYCMGGLRSGRYATGTTLIAQRVFNGLSQPRGVLRGGEAESLFGFDLSGKVGAITSASDAAALPGQIRSYMLQDEQIEEVLVTLTRATEGAGVSYTVELDVTTSLGPFSLKLAVSAVTIELLGLPSTEAA